MLKLCVSYSMLVLAQSPFLNCNKSLGLFMASVFQYTNNKSSSVGFLSNIPMFPCVIKENSVFESAGQFLMLHQFIGKLYVGLDQLKSLYLGMDGSEFFSPWAALLNLCHQNISCFALVRSRAAILPEPLAYRVLTHSSSHQYCQLIFSYAFRPTVPNTCQGDCSATSPGFCSKQFSGIDPQYDPSELWFQLCRIPQIDMCTSNSPSFMPLISRSPKLFREEKGHLLLVPQSVRIGTTFVHPSEVIMTPRKSTDL